MSFAHEVGPVDFPKWFAKGIKIDKDKINYFPYLAKYHANAELYMPPYCLHEAIHEVIVRRITEIELQTPVHRQPEHANRASGLWRTLTLHNLLLPDVEPPKATFDGYVGPPLELIQSVRSLAQKSGSRTKSERTAIREQWDEHMAQSRCEFIADRDNFTLNLEFHKLATVPSCSFLSRAERADPDVNPTCRPRTHFHCPVNYLQKLARDPRHPEFALDGMRTWNLDGYIPRRVMAKLNEDPEWQRLRTAEYLTSEMTVEEAIEALGPDSDVEDLTFVLLVRRKGDDGDWGMRVFRKAHEEGKIVFPDGSLYGEPATPEHEAWLDRLLALHKWCDGEGKESVRKFLFPESARARFDRFM